jgi:hypothetical protein
MQRYFMQKTQSYIDNENSLQYIQQLERELKTARKIRDKGGCVIVEGSNDVIITVYNYSKTKH